MNKIPSATAQADRSYMSAWDHGSGRPASWTIATNSKQDNGVVEAGLMMTGQPNYVGIRSCVRVEKCQGCCDLLD